MTASTRARKVSESKLPEQGRLMGDALNRSGTFHAIGTRLLREYASDIGLDAAFSIHGREDSADLMNLVRHDLGFSQTERRFPMKGSRPLIFLLTRTR